MNDGPSLHDFTKHFFFAEHFVRLFNLIHSHYILIRILIVNNVRER